MTASPARGFWSDNASGVHPEVMAALVAADDAHAPAYGADRWTAVLAELAEETFGPGARIFPVLNGTGANVVGLQALVRRWESVVTSARAHVVTDESTAPQLVGGLTVRALPTADGTLAADDVAAVLAAHDGSVHHARPAAVSLTQSTELGTIYTAAELAAIAAVTHAHDARLHVDGARIANAAVRLGLGLGEATAGVDVLSFGGTKNGLLLGDAVVVRDPDLADAVAHLRKASAQLASKARFVSAQLAALLTDDLWRRNAQHANDAADLLAARLGAELGIDPVYPVEANAVFIPVPPERLPAVVAQAPVLTWDAEQGVVRAVASFDTTDDDVARLVETLARILG
ncbi:threonine aldolase family protein [Georgenia wangjunii]|uniref:threonine aldolase family protein n=1 Tax=Georgenia wangjunii TaxID=3117730 RepID=UPI002F25F1F5